MSTPAGTGPLALLDLPDPCLMGTGDAVAAYGLALRLLTPPGVLEALGDPAPYDSLDLRAYVGSRLSPQALRDLESACNQVLGQDERADSVSCSLSLSGGVLAATVQAEGAAGPFGFVLSVDDASSTTFRSL